MFHIGRNDRLRRPALADWRNWSYEDYLCYLLSEKAAKGRLKGDLPPSVLLPEDELDAFCRPIRERIKHLFDSRRPTVSIVLAAHNEEHELLPTFASYTMLDTKPGLAELIVVDNASTDQTAAIIHACGARYVRCGMPGVGHAKNAGFQAIAGSSRYVWLSDADTRVVSPLRYKSDLNRRATPMRTSLDYLQGHPRTLGVSTCGTIESAHWSYRLTHELAVLLGRSRRYNCWAGYNQFFRREALEQIGIDTDVEFWEDQHRHFQLARLGKRTGCHVEGGNSQSELIDPIYSSGRRYATLNLVVRHHLETIRRPRLPRDEYGFPVHPRKQGWRRVRPD